MVKLDLGCHVDGFIAVVAHTIVVPPVANPDLPPLPPPLPVSGPRADVMVATYLAADLAAKMIKAGNTNKQVSMMSVVEDIP